MYRSKFKQSSNYKTNTGVEAVPLERKIERMVQNGEPLESNSQNVEMIYTDRKDGVLAGLDIRTDRFELAVEASTKVAKGKQAKRQNLAKKEPKAGSVSDTVVDGGESKD